MYTNLTTYLDYRKFQGLTFHYWQGWNYFQYRVLMSQTLWTGSDTRLGHLIWLTKRQVDEMNWRQKHFLKKEKKLSKSDRLVAGALSCIERARSDARAEKMENEDSKKWGWAGNSFCRERINTVGLLLVLTSSDQLLFTFLTKEAISIRRSTVQSLPL